MSAALARERAGVASNAKLPIVSDVDLRALRIRGVALELALLARQEAVQQGRLQPALPNERAARELGVSVRTVQRAKRRLEEAGVALIERKSRYMGPRGSENLAHRYQLDRRKIEALRVFTRPRLSVVNGHEGMTDSPPLNGSLNPSEEEWPTATPPPPKGRGRSRAGPVAAAAAATPEKTSVTTATGSPRLRAAPDERPRSTPSLTGSAADRDDPRGWRSALPDGLVAWLDGVGAHYADDRRAFHAELAERERRQGWTLLSVERERTRQHVLRELAEGRLQLSLEAEA